MLNKIPKTENITLDNMTDDIKNKINDWLNISVNGFTNHNIADDINDIIRSFMDNYNIELPNKFNDELILFLYNNSIH